MSREIEISGFQISSSITPCAYKCSYCQMSNQELEQFGHERYLRVIERFIEYKEKTGMHNWTFHNWMGNTYDSDLPTLKTYAGQFERMGNWKHDMLLLGGIKHRSRSEMRSWLQERQEIGCTNLVASFLGYGDTHDKWQRKKGNFDFLMMSLELGKELGMHLTQRMFLTKSTLPLIDGLLDRLEAIGGDAEHVAYLLFYSGLARKFDAERLTNQDLDSQSNRVKATYRGDRPNWKAENDWVKTVMEAPGVEPENIWLGLNLTDENIEQVEAMSCEAIIEDLTARTREAYRNTPSKKELCAASGQPGNESVYMFRWDMEACWMDRWLETKPLTFDRSLTHFGR